MKCNAVYITFDEPLALCRLQRLTCPERRLNFVRHCETSEKFFVRMFVRACIFQRLWSSGRIPRCHRGDPGSIPGKRIFDLSIFRANKSGGSVEAIIVLGQILIIHKVDRSTCFLMPRPTCSLNSSDKNVELLRSTGQFSPSNRTKNLQKKQK